MTSVKSKVRKVKTPKAKFTNGNPLTKRSYKNLPYFAFLIAILPILNLASGVLCNLGCNLVMKPLCIQCQSVIIRNSRFFLLSIQLHFNFCLFHALHP